MEMISWILSPRLEICLLAGTLQSHNLWKWQMVRDLSNPGADLEGGEGRQILPDM